MATEAKKPLTPSLNPQSAINAHLVLASGADDDAVTGSSQGTSVKLPALDPARTLNATH
jgi:hypothetical protein